LGPLTMAVLPSAEMNTEVPWAAPPTAPEPTNLGPCCVQTPPLRVHTHAAPAPPYGAPPLSFFPPTMAVLPSPESETDCPWYTVAPTAPVPTSFGPCCTNCASATAQF